ncbi:MAG TPA: hypothetical protein PLV42_13120 [bacterium]|nr:hypothetical protein [bacterium]
MRAAIFICILAATVILMADGTGVTSRVRITADESNRNWEQTFFGDRLAAMKKTDETADDLLIPDADAAEKQQKGTELKALPLKGKRTIEYHIIQEETEEGDSSRKVKKRVIIEKESPDAPAPRK